MKLLNRAFYPLCFLLILTSLGVSQQPTTPTTTPTPTPSATPTSTPTPTPTGTPTPTTMPTPTPPPETQPGEEAVPAAPPVKPVAQPEASTNPATQSPSDRERELQRKEQSQRILGVVPEFGVTRQHAAPLTMGQKFHLSMKSSFDPFLFAAAGLQAGVSQATNEFPGYGQGAAGYGKRYGATFADQVSGNVFANFVYPSLLKEDPRYFRLGVGSFGHRFFYSLAQEFVTVTDRGTRRFNFSNVLGAFSTGGLSNVYYPSTDRGFGLTMNRSAISLLYGSVGGLVDEFWPDVNHRLFHRHPKEAKNEPQAVKE